MVKGRRRGVALAIALLVAAGAGSYLVAQNLAQGQAGPTPSPAPPPALSEAPPAPTPSPERPSPSPTPRGLRITLAIANFAGGAARSITPREIVIETRGGRRIVLHLSPDTIIWDGTWVKDMPIELGDQVQAMGPRRADGSHDVEKLWVNMARPTGVISEVRQGAEGLQFRLRAERGEIFLVRVDPRTEVSSGRGAPAIPKGPFADSPIELAEGQAVQVDGRKLKDGSLLAVRLQLRVPE